MSDKFLNTGGTGNTNISNGSSNIFAASLGSDNLLPSMPIKTNSVKQLISTKLEIADINNLRSELDNVLTNPFQGTLQADDFRGDSIKDKTETSTINLTQSEIDIVSSVVKINGQQIDPSVDLQEAYNNSTPLAETQLAISKPWVVRAVDTSTILNIDGDTNEIRIQGDLLVNGSNINTGLTAVEDDVIDIQNDKYDKTGGILTGDLVHQGDVVQFNNASSFQIQNQGSCQIQNVGPLSIKSFSTTGDIVMGGTAKIRNLTNGINPLDAINVSQLTAVQGDVTNLTTKTQNIQLSTVPGTTDILGLVRMDGLTSNNNSLIISAPDLTLDSNNLLVNSVMGCNDFVKYEPSVNFLSPPSDDCLVARGYVNQQIANIPAGDLTNSLIDRNFDENMSTTGPLAIFDDPDIVYNQGISIDIPLGGGSFYYPQYTLNNGGVVVINFTFPQGTTTGDSLNIQIGDSSIPTNNFYLVDYRPQVVLNNLSLIEFINGGSAINYQATVPSNLDNILIQFDKNPENIIVSGATGLGGYIEYLNGTLTPSFLNAGISISSSLSPIEVQRVQLTNARDIISSLGDSTASYTKLNSAQKRYDSDDSVPQIEIENGKPVSWLGIQNEPYTFQIQKDKIGFSGVVEGNAPIQLQVESDYYNKKWSDESQVLGGNLSNEKTTLGFNQNPGFTRFVGTVPIWDFNSVASFNFKTRGMSSAGDLYIGFTDEPTPSQNALVGFTGQGVNGVLYTNGVSVTGVNNLWKNGDECYFSVSGGQWKVDVVGGPGFARAMVDNGKPYYFCIINNQGGGNFVEMDITEVITNFTTPSTKQLSVQGSIEFTGKNSVYVDTLSENLVFKDNTIPQPYPIAGKNYELITKFDPSLTQATLYSDGIFTFFWDGVNKQPQFSKSFTGFVDTTMLVVKGNTALPFANTISFAEDINPASGVLSYFYGGLVNIAFNHVNWSTRTSITIVDESGNTRPSYIIEYITGNVNLSGTFTLKKILP